jgi:hypothetical protein
LSSPDTSTCLSLPGVARFWGVGDRTARARFGVARPCSRVFGAEIRTSHPSGSRCWRRKPAPVPLALSRAPRKSTVPGRVQGWRTAAVDYPEQRGASTSWLATWAHLRQRAKRRGQGLQSANGGFAPGTQSGSLSPPKSTKGLCGLERHLVAHYVEAGASHFVGYRPQGHE